MSTARAITQLIKSRNKFKLRLSVLETEKEAAIAATKERYAEKEKELKDSLAGTENALKSLGISEKEIEEKTAEIAE